MFKRALVSVSDKRGLKEFLSPLVEGGLQLVSTGGTAQFLRDLGWAVTDVSEVTGFPEVLDGRVKTLHPHIHMGLLAVLKNPDHVQTLEKFHVQPFDLIIGNLYPFEETLKKKAPEDELIENIDIGGPSFLRSASKNFETVAVVCDPMDYTWIQEKFYQLNRQDRKHLAAKVFRMVSAYDSLIAQTLDPESHNPLTLAARCKNQLRYGENHHQSAFWYELYGATEGLVKAEILQGKELSYNNILDLEACFQLCQKFSEPCVVAVKHNNPCGVALDPNPLVAVEKALKSDPLSVFGGIVAINTCVTTAMAKALNSVFLECVLAPDYEAGALELFSAKKNLRILKWDFRKYQNEFEIKSVSGGLLVQQTDQKFSDPEQWEICGEKPPSDLVKTIQFGERVCASLKSNAIAIVGEGQTLGLGMGQVNRVEAVEHALQRWQKHHPSQKNVVLVSDAFFPFPDSVELAAKSGIRWIVQPGGSLKDQDVKMKAQELKVNLVLTGLRHFKH